MKILAAINRFFDKWFGPSEGYHMEKIGRDFLMVPNGKHARWTGPRYEYVDNEVTNT